MGLKGIFFTGDALIAAFLIIGALLAASTFYVHEANKGDISYFSEDIVNVLNNLKVGEINNSYVRGLISQGNITKLNNSLLEQIGVFWAEGHDALARDFAQNVIGSLVPYELSIAISIDDQIVFMTNHTDQKSVSSYRKFISGIEHDKPVNGYTARIYLKGIDSRHTSSFTYFGGFVGQGNITKTLWLADNISQIHEMYMELDPSDDFRLYINNNLVGSYVKGSGGGGYMRPDRWYINQSYFSKLHSGDNSIDLKFNHGLGYVAGGFVRVTYSTATIADTEISYGNNSAVSRYNFPGINGIINLYDAMTIPGTLRVMKVHLKFNSRFPTYLTIGSKVVFSGSGSTSDQTVNLVNMSQYPYSLNFATMSNSTVPIRLASYNITTQNITGANGDVILITDMSGSMQWRIGSWDEQDGVIRFCNNTKLYSNWTSRRISVAKCLDINFTDIIMGQTGNREWLVDFEEGAQYFSSNPLDLTKQKLMNQIKSYTNTPSGGTCLCCAINLAYSILNSFTKSNRSKYVVVLTDGIPTYCCGSSGHGGNQRCANGTSTTTQFAPSQCTGGQEDCNNNDCNDPRNNAIWSTQRLKNQFKARVYTIGMGPIVSCRQANITLKRIAQVGNGTSNMSQNATKLRSIFRTIANSIVAEVNQTNQQLFVMGNLSRSILYSESYIEMNYTPIVPTPSFGKITVTAESDRFGNSISRKNLYLPSTTQLISLQTTSYSADKWTDNVTIFNGSKWKQVFSLVDTFVDYSRLGDPFVVMIPANLVKYDRNNTIMVKTGTGPNNATNGSSWNKLVYSVSIANSVGYSSVYAVRQGCIWSLRFDDGSNTSLRVPATYNGTRHCSFYPANFSTNDAYNQAAYTLFGYLDFDNDGKLAVKVGQDNVEPESNAVEEVPSMWGPSIIEVRVWK